MSSPTTQQPSTPAQRRARPRAGAPAALPEVRVPYEGDLDTAAVERLRALLTEAVAPRTRVLLDVSTVQHLSYAALGVLVATHCRLRDSGGGLVLQAPTAAVLRVLRISGLHRVLVVEDVAGRRPRARTAPADGPARDRRTAGAVRPRSSGRRAQEPRTSSEPAPSTGTATEMRPVRTS